MAHWRTMIEKDHLGAWDLVDDNGKRREYTLRIAKVESKVLKTKEKPKGLRRVVVTFEKASKAFVANTTNCETIESMYGPDVAGWVGKLVTLAVRDVKSPKGSGTVPGIRVLQRKPPDNARPDEVKPREVDPEIRSQQDEAFDRGDNPDEH